MPISNFMLKQHVDQLDKLGRYIFDNEPSLYINAFSDFMLVDLEKIYKDMNKYDYI